MPPALPDPAFSSAGAGDPLDGTRIHGRSPYAQLVRYQSTIASPANTATTPPSARNGPNGMAVLRPSRAPLRAITTAPTSVPVTSATKIAGATARPRKRP